MKRCLLLLAVVAILSPHAPASDPKASASTSSESPSDELARLFAEDQSDRQPPDGKEIDWNVVEPRDKSRRKRVLELYQQGALKTGKELYHAAMILQHGDRPEDYLLSHELCVTAVFKAARSERATWLAEAKWLAAASYDRFLLSIGRPQRFGTQFTSGDSTTWRLDSMEEGVTDEIRKAWSVPSIADAKRREAEMNAATK